MDNDFVIDLDAILDAVEKADVITIRFLIVPHRLLIDARHSELEGPLVKLVPRARSLEERFKAIKQLRPRFRLPDRISAVTTERAVLVHTNFIRVNPRKRPLAGAELSREPRQVGRWY